MNTPRIYTYRITFEEVPYYYYGVHKEKVFNEEYWGSPTTHKWCWELYTPKKQILEFFDSWDEATEVESRLIKEFFNKDRWCLNENCGGYISLETRSKAGKIGGRIGSSKCKELGIGIFGMSKEKRTMTAKKSASQAKKNKTGIFSLTKEEIIKNARKGGKASLDKFLKMNQEKWMCLETGKISSLGALSKYQKNRGIDPTRRVKINNKN